MSKFEFQGIDEVSFYRYREPLGDSLVTDAFAAHAAIFYQKDRSRVCVSHETLTNAVRRNGEDRKRLIGVGLSLRLIEVAHREFSYKKARDGIDGLQFPQKILENFYAGDQDQAYPFISSHYIGNDMKKRKIGGPFYPKPLGGIDGLL